MDGSLNPQRTTFTLCTVLDLVRVCMPRGRLLPGEQYLGSHIPDVILDADALDRARVAAVVNMVLVRVGARACHIAFLAPFRSRLLPLVAELAPQARRRVHPSRENHCVTSRGPKDDQNPFQTP